MGGVQSHAAAQTTETTAHYSLTFPGWLFLPISPPVLPLDPEHTFAAAPGDPAHKLSGTYVLTDIYLRELLNDIWDNTAAYSEAIADIIDSIPVVAENAKFPYRDSAGMFFGFCVIAVS